MKLNENKNLKCQASFATPIAYPYDEWEIVNKSAIGEDMVSRAGTIWKTLKGAVSAEELRFGELRYWVYFPENYDPSREYPLVVYLHGSVVSYNQPTAAPNVPWYYVDRYSAIDSMRNALNDFILFTPQVPGDRSYCQSGSAWTNMDGHEWKSSVQDTTGSTNYLKAAEKLTAGYIKDGVTYGENTYHINPACVYLVGDSMGAIGGYALLSDCPTIFAAAMLRSGIGNPNTVEAWKDTPIRIFHGMLDRNVPYEAGVKMIDALTEAKAKDAELVSVETEGHNIQHIIHMAENYKWLSQQSREISGDPTA